MNFAEYCDWLDEMPSTPKGIILTGARGETRVIARPTFAEFRSAHSALSARRFPRLERVKRTLAAMEEELEREERE